MIHLLLVTGAFSTFALAEQVKQVFGFARTGDLRLEGYDFKFMKAGPPNGEGYRMGYFKFRWKETKPIHLWGFGFGKDGLFSVRFAAFSKKSRNGWKEIEYGYCGTGAEMYPLEPDKDHVLLIPLEPHSEAAEQWVVKLNGENISVISEPFIVAQTRN